LWRLFFCPWLLSMRREQEYQKTLKAAAPEAERGNRKVGNGCVKKQNV